MVMHYKKIMRVVIIAGLSYGCSSYGMLSPRSSQDGKTSFTNKAPLVAPFLVLPWSLRSLQQSRLVHHRSWSAAGGRAVVPLVAATGVSIVVQRYLEYLNNKSKIEFEDTEWK